MSNITLVILIMAVGLGHLYTGLSLDKRLINEAEAIATGAIGGVAVSIEHRRLRFDTRWIGWYGGIVVYSLAWALGYLLIGRYAAVEGVRWFAYLLGFLSAADALCWIVAAPAWFRHLRSILRQAEAD